MATADVGGIHRTQRSRSHSPGDYNKVTYVGPNSTYFATGSEAGAAGFIIENATNVVINCSNSGTLNGSQCLVKTVYPIGVYSVTIGATGKVHVLHK